MFGVGMTEMIVIAVVALIFIGPDQIPEVARNLGKFINDLKRSTDDLKQDFQKQTGLPRNFDDWLETRRDPPPNQIAPPRQDSKVAPEYEASFGHLEGNHENPAHVARSNSFDHETLANEADDGQTVMNLDSEDPQQTKDPKKS